MSQDLQLLFQIVQLFLAANLVSKWYTIILVEPRRKRGPFYGKKWNEIFPLIMTFYVFLLVWTAFPFFITFLEHMLGYSLASLPKYFGAILQSAILCPYMTLIYKIAIGQRVKMDNAKISQLAELKSNDEKLKRYAYFFCILVVFMQMSVVGLVPYFNIEGTLYVDVITGLTYLVSLAYMLLVQHTIELYNKQKWFMRTWTIFMGATFFRNVAEGLYQNFEPWLNMAISSESIIIYLFLKVAIILSMITQCGCMISSIINRNVRRMIYD